MKKDPKVFIEHILECIERIEEYVEGATKDEFFDSVQLQDAVMRRIEIIGEATKNIPAEIKDKYPGCLERNSRDERYSHTRLLWR